MSRTVRNIIGFVLFAFFFTLVVQGQKVNDMTGLTEELIGMFGLIGLLSAYNRRFK